MNQIIEVNQIREPLYEKTKDYNDKIKAIFERKSKE